MAVRARLTPPRVTQTDWPWHKVKASSLKASLLFNGGRRMEAENFLASGFGTRVAIEDERNGLDTPGRRRAHLATIQAEGHSGRGQSSARRSSAATQVYDVRPIPTQMVVAGPH